MKEYYVSPSGSDTASGDHQFPWRTLERVNRTRLEPGDHVLLLGGATHRGHLMLRQGGTERDPICISSYGQGRAHIDAGDGGGLVLWNVGHISIQRLDLAGSGPERNRADGICLYAEGDGPSHNDIQIEDVEVRGFGRCGVSIGTRSERGFHGVLLRRVSAHHNGYAGIFSWGPTSSYGHEEVTIRDCDVHSNAGVRGLVHSNGHGIHSGHGILLTSLRRGLVENCRAHHNGDLNTAHQCGPAGIWVSQATSVHLRRNESYANRTAAATDGGGFGLDGGVTDSSMEDNYSHDNDGPGFQLAQFYGAAPARGNRMVGNRSENDARRNDHGALQVWAAEGHSIDSCLIQGNTVTLEPSECGRPRALSIVGQTPGLRMLDNHFHCPHVPVALYVERQRSVHLCRNNVLFSVTGCILWHGQEYPDVVTWLSAAEPQGWSGSEAVAVESDNAPARARSAVPGGELPRWLPGHARPRRPFSTHVDTDS